MSDSQSRDSRPARLWPQLVILLGLLAVMILGITIVDHRLDSIEERLSFAPGRVNEPASSGPPVEIQGEGHAYYVPAYSHIYSRGGQPVLLETTLSIHNTDTKRPLTLDSVRYFDTDGNPVRDFLPDGAMTLAPFATATFLVEEKDVSGGSGANFLVEWTGEEEISVPVIEALMVARDGTHGLSFVTEGREIAR